jgi:hypothetical protein
MLPKGAYYRYLNTGAGNLVVLRIGAASGQTRIASAPSGVPATGRAIPRGIGGKQIASFHQNAREIFCRGGRKLSVAIFKSLYSG